MKILIVFSISCCWSLHTSHTLTLVWMFSQHRVAASSWQMKTLTQTSSGYVYVMWVIVSHSLIKSLQLPLCTYLQHCTEEAYTSHAEHGFVRLWFNMKLSPGVRDWQCYSSQMYINTESRSFLSVSHSNELQWTSLWSHTSTHSAWLYSALYLLSEHLAVLYKDVSFVSLK